MVTDMNDLILSKESSESEIKRYFNAVLELSKSDNEFPINLDEVWMLVYSEKGKAVRALKENFIEGVDYVSNEVFAQNGKNPQGGRPSNEYHLTVSCMEFFIARKVRPVFEVYRQVFHKVVKHELSRKELALMVVQAEEERERLALENKQLEAVIEQKQVIIEQKEAEISIKDGKIEILEPKGESYDAIMSSQGLVTINMIAAFLGISARKLNQLLCQWGVQYKQSKCYFLTYKYRDKGYTKHVPFPYLDNGVQKSREHMYWTEAGRKFVIDLYNSKTAA